MALIDVQGLSTRFHTQRGVLPAVQDVSFALERGGSLGIVGESGSGKSVTCYSLLQLLPRPSAEIHAGRALFYPRADAPAMDLLRLSEAELRRVRGKHISLIFQDAMTALNPYLSIATQLTETLRQHEVISRPAARERAIAALSAVGVRDAFQRIDHYPHQFSGGMRQRVMIAMALITQPQLLICDEPTTALDVTVQAQVLDLLRERQAQGTALIFISHDLAVVSSICETILVMYAGRVVEAAPRDLLFAQPRHAYTRSLLRTIPALHSRNEPLHAIPGQAPHLLNLPPGCAFRPRNVIGRADQCLRDVAPPLIEIAPRHWVQQCPGCLA